jgi:O-antigen ligase
LFPVFIEVFSVIVDRMNSAIDNVELGGRIAIYLFAINVISSNLFFGVGRNGYTALANLEFGFSPSPHNVFLEVLVYGGIVAELLWLFVVYKISVIAFRTYKYLWSYSCLLLLMPVLINSLTGQVFNNTLIFYILAIIIAIGAKVPKRPT